MLPSGLDFINPVEGHQECSTKHKEAGEQESLSDILRSLTRVNDFHDVAFTIEFGEGSAMDYVVHDSSDADDIHSEGAEEPEVRREEDRLEVGEQVKSD